MVGPGIGVIVQLHTGEFRGIAKKQNRIELPKYGLLNNKVSEMNEK